jgi:hypothetical protein
MLLDHFTLTSITGQRTHHNTTLSNSHRLRGRLTRCNQRRKAFVDSINGSPTDSVLDGSFHGGGSCNTDAAVIFYQRSSFCSPYLLNARDIETITIRYAHLDQIRNIRLDIYIFRLVIRLCLLLIRFLCLMSKCTSLFCINNRDKKGTYNELVTLSNE